MLREQLNQLEVDKADHLALPEGVPLSRDARSELGVETIHPAPQTAPLKLKLKSGHWLLIGLSICCTLGGIAVLAFLWLTSLPPVTDCQKISPLSPDMERLYCAEAAARSGKLPELVAGLKLVEQWPSDHPLYHEAQRWTAEWSKSVLLLANQKMSQSDLKGAVALAKQIPKSSAVYPEAQAAIAKWQKRWQKSAGIYAEAKTAIKNQNWDQAYDRILALRDSNYAYWHSKQADALSAQILVEKQARRSLAQARQLAKTGQLEEVRAAVVLVSKIDPKTYTRIAAQPNLNQWSEALLKTGWQHWQNKNLAQAIALAQQAALNPKLSGEAQNLVKLSRARQLAVASDSHWQTSSKQVWNLMEAVAAARQIKPESRFYPQAQASLKSWTAQLENVTQLQFAQLAADLGQRQSLETAIAAAKQVAPNQPRRLQAQTLAAHWTHEIERLEDQPILAKAQKLAAPGTVSALRAAITQASQISTERFLRGEAQGLIYGWNRQIEVLQDRPFLDLARTLANRGKLQDAVQAATVIRPGRALYVQAQAAIADWQAEIWRLDAATRKQIAEDRAAAAKKLEPADDSLEPTETLEWSESTRSAQPRANHEAAKAGFSSLNPSALPFGGLLKLRGTELPTLSPVPSPEPPLDPETSGIRSNQAIPPAPSEFSAPGVVSPNALPNGAITAPPSPESPSASTASPTPTEAAPPANEVRSGETSSQRVEKLPLSHSALQ